jgi:hypothetical protein
MKNKVKELRIKIDGLAQLVKELKPLEQVKTTTYSENGCSLTVMWNTVLDGPPKKWNSQEINKSYDSLILAKAWLGKVLGELGEETPYKNDGNRKTIEDIEPTADTSNKWISYEDWLFETKEITRTHIEKIDCLREEIKKINNQVKEQLHFVESERMLLLERVEQYLSEARFWLGFELQRVKENEQNKSTNKESK